MSGKDGEAEFQLQRMQLVSHLGAVAETMRQCAIMAERFQESVERIAFAPGAHLLPVPPAAAPAATNGKPGRKRKAKDMEDGAAPVAGAKKTRKKREPKDPNAPRRPPSSYILFQNAVRNQMKELNPGRPNSELLSIIGQKWASLDEAGREKYVTQHLKAKDQYTQEYSQYIAKKQGTDPDEPLKSPDEVIPAAAAAKPPKTPKAKAKAAPPPAPQSVPTIEHTAADDTSSVSSESEEGSASGSSSSAEEEDDEEEDDEDEVEDEDDAPPAKKSKAAGHH